MKSQEVVRNFLSRDRYENSTGSLSSNGNCLYSYSTCIAEFDRYDRLWVNITKYSVTTSKHQSMLRRERHPVYMEVNNITRNRVHIINENERV